MPTTASFGNLRCISRSQLEAGATVVVPTMDVLDVGTMAYFADPLGAIIGVWQPKLHKGAGIVNEPGTLTWNELVTTDSAATGKRVGELGGAVMMPPRDVEPGRFAVVSDPAGATFQVLASKSQIALPRGRLTPVRFPDRQHQIASPGATGQWFHRRRSSPIATRAPTTETLRGRRDPTTSG